MNAGDSLSWLCRECRDRAGGTRLATTPAAAGENPSMCYSTGECLQATQLSPLLPLPCPCPSLLQGGPSSLLAPRPSNQCAGSARKHAAHTVQTDAQTPARAQGHMPTAVEVTTAQALCLLDSHGPRAPQAWSPWLSALGCGRQQERCQQLVGPSGCWQPTRRRAIALQSHRGMNALHVAGSAGSVSSCRTICGSQPRFEGAKALTCRPA